MLAYMHEVHTTTSNAQQATSSEQLAVDQGEASPNNFIMH
jgi:hypothetical protein